MPRQLNVHGPQDVRIDEVAPVTPGPDDVLVQIAYCGICGTDRGYVARGETGRPNSPRPLPLGHEASGVVTRVGSRVRGIEVGARVAVNAAATFPSIGNGGPDGALADELLVRSATMGRDISLLPANVPLDVGALTEPMSVARHGVNRSRAAVGEQVVVLGAGPIGLAAILWLRRLGCEEIVLVDVNEDRLQLGSVMGAAHLLGSSGEQLRDDLIDIHGSQPTTYGPAVGTDVFLDFTGYAPVARWVNENAKRTARLMLVGLSGVAELDLNQVVIRELEIIGSQSYPTEFDDVAQDLGEVVDQAAALISHRYPLEEFSAGLETVVSGAATTCLIAVNPDT